jgi:hypothetical protein
VAVGAVRFSAPPLLPTSRPGTREAIVAAAELEPDASVALKQPIGRVMIRSAPGFGTGTAVFRQYGNVFSLGAPLGCQPS